MGARCVCLPAIMGLSFGFAVMRYFSSILGRATVVGSALPLVPQGHWNSSQDANDETFDGVHTRDNPHTLHF
jgi:hypothetical protein